MPEAVDAVLDADAMDALLDEAESVDAVEPPVVPQALPKGFSSASEREEPVAEAPQPKLSWFQRLRAGLARTSSQLTTQISALFTKRKLDEDTLDELEDLLIQSDLGVETAMRITGALSSERYGKDVSGEDVARIMAGEITKVLKPVRQTFGTRSFAQAACHSRRGRQRHRQDDDHRQACCQTLRLGP